MKQERNILILRGLPASGKSSYAKSLVDYVRINKDDIRKMINVESVKIDERIVISIRDGMIKELHRKGKNIVVDDTNLNPVHVENIVNMVNGLNFKSKKYNYAVTIKDMMLDEIVENYDNIEIVCNNDSLRKESVGKFVILEMYKKWVVGGKYKKYDYLLTVPRKTQVQKNQNLPKAYIVDIDGTIADNSHRNPHDLTLLHLDNPIEDVIRVIERLKYWANAILFVSGRDRKYYNETKKWLESNLYFDDFVLYMRPEGNVEEDSKIKSEIYNKYISQNYDILGVFDDRDRVVQMWREYGLTVFQTNYGDF